MLPANSTKFFSITVNGFEEGTDETAALEGNDGSSSDFESDAVPAKYLCFRLLFSNLQDCFIPFCFRINKKPQQFDVVNKEGKSVRNSLFVLQIEEASGQYAFRETPTLRVRKKSGHTQ